MQPDVNRKELPALRIEAILHRKGDTAYRKTVVLAAVHGEMASFVLPHLSAHVEILDHGPYHMLLEMQAIHEASLLYDGRRVRLSAEEEYRHAFCHPADNTEHPEEEISLSLRMLFPTEGPCPDREAGNRRKDRYI